MLFINDCFIFIQDFLTAGLKLFYNKAECMDRLKSAVEPMIHRTPIQNPTAAAVQQQMEIDRLSALARAQEHEKWLQYANTAQNIRENAQSFVVLTTVVIAGLWVFEKICRSA